MEKIAKFIQNLINRFFPKTVESVVKDLNQSGEQLEEIRQANVAVRKQNALMIERLLRDNTARLEEETKAADVKIAIRMAVAGVTD